MRHKLIFILTLLTATANSQSVQSIDNLVSEIEKTIYTDTITITDSPSVATRPIKVIAFLKGDTLLKTVAKYSNSTRLRFSYYDKQQNTPLCVKDIDSLTKDVLVEVYGKNYDVFKSTIIKPLEEQEAKQPYRVLHNADFSTEIGFAVVDNQAKKYKFTGKLVETVPMTPHCGTFAFAIVHKFEVLTTTFPNYDKKYVLIIQTCPEFLKDNFFKAGTTYEISVATNSGVTFGYSVVNNYEKENLPTFWTREIIKQK
jgi:hypothetical protein